MSLLLMLTSIPASAAVDDPRVVVLPAVEGLVGRSELTAAGDHLFFADDNGIDFPGHVWAIDPGSPDAAPVAIEKGSGLLSAAGRLFFTRVDYYDPRRLRVDTSWWTTDGTLEGTHQFDAVTTISGLVRELSVVACDGVSYRVHGLGTGSRLFQTDAAFENHVLLGSAPQGAWYAHCVGGRLVLVGSGVDAPEHGFPDAVLQDVGARQFSGGRSSSAEASGFLYVGVSVGAAGPSAGKYTLLRTDGTDEGTVTLLVDEVGGRPQIDSLVGIAGDVGLFTGGDDDVAYALWATNGTPGNLSMLVPIPDVRTFQPLGSSGGLFYFTLGVGLWRTDGTPSGTMEISAPFTPAVVSAFVGFDDVVYFGLVDDPLTATQGARLWRSDGTSSGTVALAVLPGRGVELARAGDRVFVLSDPSAAPPPPVTPSHVCDDETVPLACELRLLIESPACDVGASVGLPARQRERLSRLEMRVRSGHQRASRRTIKVLARLERRLVRPQEVRRLGEGCARTLAARVHDALARTTARIDRTS
ncbi:MAG TPA: hypothetical protein VGR62_25970 [Candidatus Binatia bacterium]|jgi:hypothetical protein|nr:hypothetical protein [Candidatus Binatia bacterium]